MVGTGCFKLHLVARRSFLNSRIFAGNGVKIVTAATSFKLCHPGLVQGIGDEVHLNISHGPLMLYPRQEISQAKALVGNYLNIVKTRQPQQIG